MGSRDTDAAPTPKRAHRTRKGLKPGLVGQVKFVKGEEKLRHASLRTFGRRTRECNRPTYAAADADLQRDY